MLDLFTPGAYLRCPGGNVEDPSRHKLAVEWVAMNIGSDPCVVGDPRVWAEAKRTHALAGMPTFPWLHCRSMADVVFLIDTALVWNGGHPGSAIGLNLEDVFRDFTQKGIRLGDIARVVNLRWPGQPIHIATLPWIQNGQGWAAFARAVFALEIMADEQSTFPGGKPDPAIVDQCIEHAFAEGCEKVTLMLKTSGYKPSDYGRQFAVCHSLYTGDDIEPTIPGWTRWQQQQPCTRLIEEDEPMPPAPRPWYEKRYPTGKAVGPAKLPRPLTLESPVLTGPDVEAFYRAISRGQRWSPWEPEDWDDAEFVKDFSMGRGTGNVGDSGVRGFQRQEWPNDESMQTGKIGDDTYQRIRRALIPVGPNTGRPLLDPVAIRLLRQAAEQFDGIDTCYPIPAGHQASVCQDLHPTAGLLGNWAKDFCAAGGTPVVISVDATIRRLSGHDPREGSDDEIGIFGWSIHAETTNGYRWFDAHYGERFVKEGQFVKAGTVIGKVGRWPGDPGRSHLHRGVTSPLGEADAKAQMNAVSAAPRV